MTVLGLHPAPKKNLNDSLVLLTLSIRPLNSHGKSLKPQSVFSISTFLSKAIIWQTVSVHYKPIDSHSCLVTVLIFPPISRQRLNSTDTPNFSGFVDSAAMIQTSTPHAMKCLISFRNVAILTLSYPKHSIVSKTSLENSPWNRQPQNLKNEFLSHLLSTLTNSRQKRGPQKF